MNVIVHLPSRDRLHAGTANVIFLRITVDWDTSQADDFRTRGVPWTIKRTSLECGRETARGLGEMARYVDQPGIEIGLQLVERAIDLDSDPIALAREFERRGFAGLAFLLPAVIPLVSHR